MFPISRCRSDTSLRARPNLEQIEGRLTPATFTLYGTTSPTEGLVVLQSLTPVNTDADPDYEQVTFTFMDTDPDSEIVSLLVYSKTDDSLPPNIDRTKQTLLTVDQVTTTGEVGWVYTLTASLPACAYQADAAVGPLSTAVPPVGYDTALNPPFAGALGENDCPGSISGDPSDGFDPHTQGYWKNHPAAWPVGSLTLGGVVYSQDQLLAILNTPVRGNGAISLAHQLIAAKLNLAAGAHVSDATLDIINAADVALGSNSLVILGTTSISGFSLRPAVTSGLVGKLTAFNETDL